MAGSKKVLKLPWIADTITGHGICQRFYDLEGLSSFGRPGSHCLDCTAGCQTWCDSTRASRGGLCKQPKPSKADLWLSVEPHLWSTSSNDRSIYRGFVVINKTSIPQDKPQTGLVIERKNWRSIFSIKTIKNIWVNHGSLRYFITIKLPFLKLKYSMNFSPVQKLTLCWYEPKARSGLRYQGIEDDIISIEIAIGDRSVV